jgi:group I intron endonuclease
MSRGIIYLITNKENGYKYVGQTTLPMNKIWQEHLINATQMSSTPLHKAFRKYGAHRFGIQEIDECNGNLLSEREQHWIQHYNPEYNVIEKKKIEKPIPVVENKPRPKSNTSHLTPFTSENRGNGKHSGLKIRGKNLETGRCKDYENARMAALEITGNPNNNGNILLAARNNGTAYGHKWLILEEKSKKKSVFGVNKKTELIEVRFESIAEAVRILNDNKKSTSIIKSLRNPGRFSWKGYYWFYS